MKQIKYQKITLEIIFMLGLVFSYVPESFSQDNISISGEWNVNYLDRELGKVKGKAIVSEDEKSVKVTLEHPETQNKYTLTSTNIKRNKENIEIILEGRSPESNYIDGQGYPEQSIIVAEGISNIKINVGNNKLERKIAKRKVYDLDIIKLNLVVKGQSELHGEWNYKADPITQRDQEGFGRVGTFTIDENEEGIQNGIEYWYRPQQLVVGAFPIEDQLSITRYLETAAYSHPFQDNANKNKYIRRTLFIFGKNLPKDVASAKFISKSEFIEYGVVRFPDSNFQMPGGLNAFVRGKEKLFSNTLPEAHDDLKKMDFMTVDIKLKKDVMPGLQSFTLNDEEVSWMLQFGDNIANIDFVRKINPDLSRGNFETTQDIFAPELVQIEIKTQLNLDTDVIQLSIGKNGKVLKLGQNVLLDAKRIDKNSKIYRTDLIAITKASGPALPPNQAKFKITVNQGDKLNASIAESGLISFVPPPAKARIHFTPAMTTSRISYLWKDYLAEAAVCYDTNVDNWDTDNYEFVGEISRRLVLEGKLTDLSLVTLPGVAHEIFYGTKLKTDFQLGDHAAMLLMRQTFLEMMDETLHDIANQYQSDEEYLIFRKYIDPYRWNAIDHPILQVETDVTGKDGKKIPFFDTYGIEDETKKAKDIDQWIFKATRELIDQYIEILFTSREKAEEIDACDLEELLLLTGNTFSAVENTLHSRLMKLDANTANKTHQWVPDEQARYRIQKIASKYEQVKSHIRLSEADTNNLVAATAVVTLPVFVTTGAVVASVVGLAEVLFESGRAISKYNESQAEIEFAKGTVDILGYGRYDQAKEEEFDYVDLTIQIAISIGMEYGVGKAFDVVISSLSQSLKNTRKSFQRGLNKIRAKRGKNLLSQHNFDIELLPKTLNQKELRDIGEYVLQAGLARRANRLLNDEQTKVLAYMDKINVNKQGRPEWAKNLNENIHNDLKYFYHRTDIQQLIKSDSQVVLQALNGNDRQLALSILTTSPVRNAKQFNALLKARKRFVQIEPNERYMNQAAEGDEVSESLLEKNHWKFEFQGPEVHGHGLWQLTAFDANGSAKGAKAAMVRSSYENGVFKMQDAFIYDTNPWINAGLDIPLKEGKGVPTIQFMFLRMLKKFDIGFAGSGNKLSNVVLADIVNVPTIYDVNWLKKTYFTNKNIEELVNDDKFGKLLMETEAVLRARDLLEKAGYKVDSARLKIDPNKTGDFPANKILKNYKPLNYEETVEEFSKRYSFSDNEKLTIYFDIELDLTPTKSLNNTPTTLRVEEFDPTLNDSDITDSKNPLEVREKSSDTFNYEDFETIWTTNRAKERVIREEELEELLERRNKADIFTTKDGKTTRKKVRYLVHGDTKRLKDIMTGFSAGQAEVFEGNINKYAKEMIQGDFDWGKIKKEDRIILNMNGKVVKHGHHRFIAAKIAADATGRPLMDAPNAIIPETGFGPRENTVSDYGNFDIKVKEGFK